MTVTAELAGCRSTFKDSFASLLDKSDSDVAGVCETMVECIRTLCKWSQPTQIQKTTSKDFQSVLRSKIQESKAADGLVVSLKACMQCMKDANDAINPLIFELAGTLLELLHGFDRITGILDDADGSAVHLRGSQIYDYYVDRMLAFKWHPANLIQFTVLMRDLKGLGVKRTQGVIDKIVSMLPLVAAEETPALFYQLLLLGRGNTEVTGMTREAAQKTVAVFNGIIGYFSTLESMGNSMTDADQDLAKKSRKLESQCANHIVLALKHNQWLANEFLKHVKRLTICQIPRFALMILLSMTESFRFASVVPGLIKSNIISCLANAEVYSKHAEIVGLQKDTFERLQNSYEELVKGLSFEAETALKGLIQLGLDMLRWTGNESQRTCLHSLSSSILQAIYSHHKYARNELVVRIVDHLCEHDDVSLAIHLDGWYQQEPRLVGDILASKFAMIPYGKAWARLAALTVKEKEDELRSLMLSQDDEMMAYAFDALRSALQVYPKDFQVWSLVRFAMDRLHHRQSLFAFLRSLPEADLKAIQPYLTSSLLLKKARGEAEWDWPKMVTNCLDTQSGSILLHLPSLMTLLGDDSDAEAAVKNLVLILDNQAGVRWFEEAESMASQDLKRPLISDLHEAAIVLNLTRLGGNMPRSFRLFNRHKDFLSGCTGNLGSSLSLRPELVVSALSVLVSDQLATHGIDDLVKWLLGKLNRTNNGEHCDAVINDIWSLLIKSEGKLKDCFGPLLEKSQNALISMEHLNWAIEAKLGMKDLVPLIDRLTFSDDACNAIAKLSVSDVGSVKHVLAWMLSGSTTRSNELAKDVLIVLGEIDADDSQIGNEQDLVQYKFVGKKTVTAVFTGLLSWTMETIGLAEWTMRQIKLQLKNEHYSKDSIKSICKVMCPAVQVLVTLTKAALVGPLAEKLQLCLQKTYRFASLFLAFLMAIGNPFDLEPLKALFGLIAGSLSPNIYTLIPLVQQIEAERAKETLEVKRMKKTKDKTAPGSGTAGSAKAAREAKILPTLIFNIELFDRHILEISHKSNIQLVDQIHRSTARDFRIQTEELEAALQNFQLDAISDDGEDESSSEKKEIEEDTITSESN